MRKDLLLDIQRKVLGGYINAEEFSIQDSHIDILSTTLNEELFDLVIHKAVARACVKLKELDTPITEYTVLDFLQQHNLPKGVQQEAEYTHLMSEYAITKNSFNTYIDMIIKHKMES